MKYAGYLLVFLVWIFANGFWQIAKAPEHFTSCQQIEWAQEKNNNKFRPDEELALWIIKGFKCKSSSHPEALQNFEKSNTAMAYVCWQLANDAGYKNDSDLFAKIISMARQLPGFRPEQHFEYMGYAANKTLKMNEEERRNTYADSCLKPLENIKSASEQGMLD